MIVHGLIVRLRATISKFQVSHAYCEKGAPESVSYSPISSSMPSRAAESPALVRTMAAVTSFTLTHDSAFVGRGQDPERAVDIVERLWLNAFWGDR